MRVLALVLFILAPLISGPASADSPSPVRPSLTAQERAWLAAGHKIRARVADYPPYMLKEPESAGLAVDYLDQIAERFGLEVEYVPADITFAEAVEDVAEGQRHYDLLLTFTPTPERKKRFAVTDEYLSAPWVIFTREDSPYILGLESLAGMKVAVEKGFLIGQKLKQDVPEVRLLEVRTAPDALMALATGRADAYVGNLAVGAFMVKEYRLTNLMVAAPTRYGINLQAMAVRPDWPELASLISKGIATMSQEDRRAIIDKWVGLEMEPSRDYRLALTILIAASLALVAGAYWNRRLAREIATRKGTESKLRQSESLLQSETSSLKKMKTQLQEKTLALEDLNTTLEARLHAAIEDRTRALKQAAAKAKDSDRAKSAFLSAVSHDLRSPLHDILGYAELLSRQLTSPAKEQIKIIQDSGNHLLGLINDILTYSRDETRRVTLQPEPVSLRQLTEHLKAAYEPVAEITNNRLRIALSTDGVDWVKPDLARLTRILRNLLDNALKFTVGGEVLLRVERIEPPSTQDPAAGAECFLEFSVEDSGVGIPPERIDTLFQPFERLERHKKIPGVGLGLAIAQQCATAMGSGITVQSSRGGATGTTFTFQLRLPICAADESLCGEDPAIEGYLGPRRRLLIADDQASSREVLSARCRAWGFSVLEAVDGADALERFWSAEPPVDLVLLDQFMPELDGWGFLDAVRSSEHDASVPIVLMSAAPLQKPNDLPDDLAPDRFALKPLAQLQLAALLSELLDLDWAHAGDAAKDETPFIDPSSLATIDAEDREQFKRMVAIGQVLELQRWARDMADKCPEKETSWRRIERMCCDLDLAALRHLAGTLAPE